MGDTPFPHACRKTACARPRPRRRPTPRGGPVRRGLPPGLPAAITVGAASSGRGPGPNRMTTVQTLLSQALGHSRDGRHDEAERLCRRLLVLQPDQAGILHVMAVAADAAGAPDRALVRAARAARLLPGVADLHVNLSLLLRRLGRTAEALEALCAAAAADPANPQRRMAVGGALLQAGRTDEAIAALKRLLALDPAHFEGYRLLGIAEHRRLALDEARAAYRRAFEVSGGRSGAMLMREALALPVIVRDRDAIAATRRRFLALMAEAVERRPALADPLREVGITAFYLAYHAADDRPLQEAMAAAYAAMCPSLLYTAPHCLPEAASGTDPGAEAGESGAERRGDGRIRLGIVSEYLYGHTIGQLNLGLVETLSRDRFHVTLLVTPHGSDSYRDRFLAAADRVVELPPDNLAEARRLIAAERLDVLHYTDIGMAPLTYLLAFSRLAPLQTLTWGHPDTTGIPTLDRFLSCGAMEPEGAEAHYSEALDRLPGATVFYRRPLFDAPPRDRRGFGLPEQATLYICPQSLFKFHPDFDDVLAEILAGDPQGLLVLIDPRNHAPPLLERLKRRWAGFSGRIAVLPGLATADFVAAMALSDVMLDPLHYSGGNTSLEALSRGTPIVTWPGAFMRGRHTYGFYRLMGMDDLVARDHAHYIELALRLGTDPAWRAEMRRKILAANAVLYEDAATIRAMEKIWERTVTAVPAIR